MPPHLLTVAAIALLLLTCALDARRILTMPPERMIEQARGQLAERPDAGTIALGDLLVISRRDGQLVLRPAGNAPPLHGHRISIAGRDGDWIAYNARGAPQPMPEGWLALTRLDLDDESVPFWSATLMIHGEHVVLTTQPRTRDGQQVALQLDNEQAVLSVTRLPVVHHHVEFRAGTIQALRTAHPGPWREHGVPLLQHLLGHDPTSVGLVDAYTVFGDLRPDEATQRRLMLLLELVDSPDPAQRRDGLAEIEQMGAPGVLAAMRLDRQTLSPEQRARMQQFLAGHMVRPVDPSDRRDPAFLLDVMALDDLALRRAAHWALEDVLGRPVTFNADGPETERRRQLTALWQEVFPPRPANERPDPFAEPATPAAE